MNLNVVRYQRGQAIAWGVLHGDQVMPLQRHFDSTGDLIRFADARDNVLPVVPDGVPLDQVTLLSPVTRNQQFVCQGANYRQHMIESGIDPDARHYNMIFRKASSCIVPAHSDVIKPARVRLLDYEVELGLVIKRPVTAAVTVTAENLADYVAGLVIVNDYSARDVQIPEFQFYKGKSFRTFGPVGPVLRLLQRNEMPYLANLTLSLTVNGEIRQRDSSANLVFGPAETLTELSGVQDFHPGDLLATGTPAGCALSVPSPFMQKLAALLPERTKWALFMKRQARRPYLQAGDQVEARIASPDGVIDLGVQRNRIVHE